MTTNPLEGSIDHAILEVVHGKRCGLYLEGWLLHRSEQILMLQFGLPGGELILISPVRRPELAERFPSIEYAGLSGYKVRIPLHDDQETPKRVFFTALIADGFTLSGCIDISPEIMKTGTRQHIAESDYRLDQITLHTLAAPWYRIQFPEVPRPRIVAIVDVRAVTKDSDALQGLQALASIAISQIAVMIICNTKEQQDYYTERVCGAKVFPGDNTSIVTHVSESEAAYVLLYDPRSVLLPGTLQAFEAMLEFRPSAGVLGGICIAADGSLAHAGGSVWYDGEISYGAKDLAPTTSALGVARQVDFVSSSCVLTPRELFVEHGGFDSAIHNRELQVLEYCLRVQITGMECWYVPGAGVRHIVSPAIEAATTHHAENYHRIYERHQQYFKGKMRFDPVVANRLDTATMQKQMVLFVLHEHDIDVRMLKTIAEMRRTSLLQEFQITLLIIGKNTAIARVAFPLLEVMYCDDAVAAEEFLQQSHYNLLLVCNAGMLRTMARYREQGTIVSTCKFIYHPSLHRCTVDNYLEQSSSIEEVTYNSLPEFTPSNHHVLYDRVNEEVFTYEQFIELVRLCDVLIVPEASLKKELSGLPVPVYYSESEDDTMLQSSFIQKVFTVACGITQDDTLWDAYQVDEHTGVFQHEAYPVSIVIPYYNQCGVMARCVASVLKHTNTRYEIIVIDDASEEEENARFKQQLLEISLPEHCSRIVYIRNRRNRGFAASVNRGMAVAANDLVLLNSDVVVPPGWLAALGKALQEEPSFASVTPFSNNADAFSLPVSPGKAVTEVDAIHSLCQQHGMKRLHNIPTAVGFCMYIRGSALQKVGFLDQTLFSPMYAEENDWCLRASKYDYSHGLCSRVFVYHEGEASLPGRKDHRGNELLEQGLRRLSFLYPGYTNRIAQYIKNDPLRNVKDSISAAYWRSCHREDTVLVLDVASEDGGSTLVRDEIAERCFPGMLQLYVWQDSSQWFLQDSIDEPEFSMELPITDPERIETIMEMFGVKKILINNIVGWSVTDVVRLVRSAKRPYSYFAHDYYSACPGVTLIGYDGTYCGAEKDTTVCHKCLSLLFPKSHQSSRLPIVDWRSTFQELLEGAEAVYVPGKTAREILTSYYPGITPKLFQYEAPSHSFYSYEDEFTNQFPFTIGVPGAIGHHKGYDIVQRLQARLAQDHVPCRVVVIGITPEHEDFWKSEDERYVVSGAYQPEDLSALLATFQVAVTLLPSIWPETYMLTADEVYASGYPAIAFGLTEAAQRIKERQAGWIIPEIHLEELVLLVKELVFQPEKVRNCAERIRMQLEQRTLDAPVVSIAKSPN